MNDLTPVNNNQLSVVVPNIFDESMDTSDVSIPYAHLLHDISDLVQNGNGQYKAGQIVNSLTNEILDPEKKQNIFIPVKVWKEYEKRNPLSSTDRSFDPAFEPGEVIWRVRPPQGLTNEQLKEVTWDKITNPNPQAQAMLMFLGWFPNNPACPMMIIQFRKTAYKIGTKLATMIRMSNNPFGKMYILSSCTEVSKATKKSYFRYNILPAGEASPEQIQQAIGFHGMYKIDKIEVQAVKEDDSEPFNGQF